MLSGLALRVERIIASILGPKGSALGGGYALQAHSIVERTQLFEDAERDLARARGPKCAKKS